MHYYPHHIGDYRSATTHLSNEEDLAYRRMLEMYYDTEKPIPIDTKWVARRLRVAEDSVICVLNDFFEMRDDGWFHARCDAEIKDFTKKADIARENGKKGGRRKAAQTLEENPAGLQSVSVGQAKTTQALTNQEPVTSNHNRYTHTHTREQTVDNFVDNGFVIKDDWRLEKKDPRVIQNCRMIGVVIDDITDNAYAQAFMAFVGNNTGKDYGTEDAAVKKFCSTYITNASLANFKKLPESPKSSHSGFISGSGYYAGDQAWVEERKQKIKARDEKIAREREGKNV